MKWYNYIFCFLSGIFIANTIPHLIQGISGNSFPSPFSNPPGKGLSTPIINVYWGLFNLVVGYLFYKLGKISKEKIWSIIIFFLAFAIMCIQLSITFTDKLKM